MSITWFLARHVADLARGEARNMGVVLVHGDQILARFVGENEQGVVDGRRVRAYETSGAYKQWVQYWRSQLAYGPENIINVAKASDRHGNYFLDAAGEWLVGEPLAPQAMLDELYGRLVEEPPESKVDEIELTVTRAAQIIKHELQRSIVIPTTYKDAADSLFFDYRLDNRVPHLMKRVTVPTTEKADTASLHSAAWTFERIIEAKRPELEGLHCIALVRNPTETMPETSLQLLEKFGNVIEAGNPDVDSERLAEYLLAF